MEDVMREIVEALPPWWALLIGAVVGTAWFFGLFWAAWLIAIVLEIES
jgi:hypothetical protein